MPPKTPPPSVELVDAARAELQRIERHSAQLERTRDDLASQLASVEAALADIMNRQALLARLTQGSASDATGDATPVGADVAEASVSPITSDSNGAPQSLRGPAVRKTAVRVLLSDSRAVDGIHYREWFDCLVRRGYTIEGKNPLAVFLTQISRSPAVVRNGRPGVYRIDRGAPARIATEIDRMHQELRELRVGPSSDTGKVREVRLRRAALTAEIEQAEKGLEEVVEIFEQSATNGVARH